VADIDLLAASDDFTERTKLRILSLSLRPRARAMERLLRALIPHVRVRSDGPPLMETTRDTFIDLRQILTKAQLPADRVEAVVRALEGVRGEVVEYAKTLPWGIRATGLRSADQVRALIDAEHIGADEVKDRVVELATLAIESQRLGRPECGSLRLLLSGPPGVGKSTLARAVASGMGLAFEKIPLGGLVDAHSLVGTHPLYDQASPGRVLEAVRRSGVENPLILLDEIDRMGASNHLGDPSARGDHGRHRPRAVPGLAGLVPGRALGPLTRLMDCDLQRRQPPLASAAGSARASRHPRLLRGGAAAHPAGGFAPARHRHPPLRRRSFRRARR
jgi:hypothetical protein